LGPNVFCIVYICRVTMKITVIVIVNKNARSQTESSSKQFVLSKELNILSLI